MATNEQLDPAVREQPAYFRGREAFYSGVDVDDCPMRKGGARIAWLTGWYDGRTTYRLGAIFQRWNETWP